MARHLAKYNLNLFFTRKRENKSLRKRKLSRVRRMAKIRAATYQLTKRHVFGSHSVIAKMLGASAASELHMPQTSLHLQIPRSFSMLLDPEAVLSLVAAFAKTCQSRAISDVFVDFSNIASQDLGAHALLDKLVDEIVAQVSMQKGRIAWKGNFPNDPALRRFIQAMGIIRQLGLTNRYLKSVDANKIHLFERRCRHYVRDMKPINPDDKTAQGNAAQRFVDHVNKCLAREGRQLTPEGRGKLCEYVVEVIDNAENHAGMVDWTIQGYVDMAMAEPACEIVIFNFGKSIAESLDALPVTSYTVEKQIRPYVDLHIQKGWLSQKWRREDLLTLIALQGSVSCKNQSPTGTRGQGTADLIQSFQAINDERRVEGAQPASMYIISGTTRILFDPKYRIVRGEDNLRKIAFNSSNDLNQPPDPKCVMPLPKGQKLPGTMIGIKFIVQSGLLQASENRETP
jgi:hypothetical protein